MRLQVGPLKPVAAVAGVCPRLPRILPFPRRRPVGRPPAAATGAGRAHILSLRPPLCLHCDSRPPVNGLGLCFACNAVKGVRVLYLRRRGWTPEWEAHLRRLTERARQRLPLFE
jgi:hypothetical protein